MSQCRTQQHPYGTGTVCNPSKERESGWKLMAVVMCAVPYVTPRDHGVLPVLNTQRSKLPQAPARSPRINDPAAMPYNCQLSRSTSRTRWYLLWRPTWQRTYNAVVIHVDTGTDFYGNAEVHSNLRGIRR